ncbi:MAG TPA: hypothetical protein VLH56_15025 [Dissulfurispiraceae bacterium]|nr:hypothetical protein [Dissulfurispiraceae bacterium]
MEKKCEICSASESPENLLFSIRIAEQADDGMPSVVSRLFCEVCLGYGAEMYESYMDTKMAPKSVSGGGCKKSH